VARSPLQEYDANGSSSKQAAVAESSSDEDDEDLIAEMESALETGE
jgi:hypothetical protein